MANTQIISDVLGAYGYQIHSEDRSDPEVVTLQLAHKGDKSPCIGFVNIPEGELLASLQAYVDMPKFFRESREDLWKYQRELEYKMNRSFWEEVFKAPVTQGLEFEIQCAVLSEPPKVVLQTKIPKAFWNIVGHWNNLPAEMSWDVKASTLQLSVSTRKELEHWVSIFNPKTPIQGNSNLLKYLK